jgi:signal peptidase I
MSMADRPEVNRRQRGQNRPRPATNLPTTLGEIVNTVLFVVVVVVLFDMAIPRSLVDGRSMQDTFQNGDRLVVSRLNYLFGQPETGDIVVFNSMNPSEVGVMLIKRVIGAPGDVVEIRDTALYVNGVATEEDYTPEACAASMCPDNRWDLGPDEYFVMGDNRNHSNDSRRFGPVPVSHIVGEVVFRYWPPQSIGIVSHIGYFAP